MNLAFYKFHLTHHAYVQYQDRVEMIEYGLLMNTCMVQLKRHEYHGTGEFVQLAGIWWVFKIRKGTVRFVTCYGKTDINIPEAKKWAKRHNDRIQLSTKKDA